MRSCVLILTELEAEHPMIKMYDEDPNTQKNIYNNLARVNYIDPNNVSHYIVGYKCTPEKTYFKIRTNPANPMIVFAILAGRQPGFSIRTRGDFVNENGVTVAKGLEVITIDYVSNPANVTSVARPEIKAINPADASEVELTLLAKTGTESIGLNNFVKEGEKLVYDKTSIGIESISNMRIISTDTKPSISFDKAFEMALRTF